MRTELDCVAAFHERCRVSESQQIAVTFNEEIQKVGKSLLKMSKTMESKVNDPDKRYLRAHLTLEETGEWFVALGNGDEIESFDALADRLYVLLGDAVTFDLPLESGFAEVHLSNMTKEKQPEDPSAERVRSKGPNYIAPDLKRVLEQYRSKKLGKQPEPSTQLQALHRGLNAMIMKINDNVLRNLHQLNSEQVAQIQMLVNGIIHGGAEEFINTRLEEIRQYVQSEGV